MDIYIRDLELPYVKELEKSAVELSKKLGKYVSRNEYIKIVLQNNCEFKLMELKEDKFDKAVDSMNYSMNEQARVLQEFIDSNSRIFHLMASGIDLDSISELMEE